MIVSRQVVARRVAKAVLAGLLLQAGLSASVDAQETMSSLQGVVRNESGRPIEQVQVLLDPGAGQRELRTDADGRFRFIGVPAGAHRLRVLRIGFQPRDTTLAAVTGTTDVVISMERLTSLSEVAVRARPTGVYGAILERDSLKAIPGARVELLGGRASDTTDASGAFSMGNARPGTFMLRVSHPAYDTRILSVRVPRDTGVGIDIVLRPGYSALSNYLEMAWADMAQRIHWAGVNSAVVGREELGGHGSSLDMAIKFAPSFAKRALVIDERACIYVDGIARPSATIRDFAVEEIESIEAYGPRGDITNTLAKQWPPKFPCGNPVTRFAPGNRAQFIAIWTRR